MRMVADSSSIWDLEKNLDLIGSEKESDQLV